MVITSGFNRDRVIELIEVVTKQHGRNKWSMKCLTDYSVDNLLKKVLSRALYSNSIALAIGPFVGTMTRS